MKVKPGLDASTPYSQEMEWVYSTASGPTQ